MASEAELRTYASGLVALHGHRNGNPSWEIIEESWDGDDPLTDAEMDEVYGLWGAAKILVTFED